eukprot:2894834-Rhodomonas_salina.1
MAVLVPCIGAEWDSTEVQNGAIQRYRTGRTPAPTAPCPPPPRPHLEPGRHSPALSAPGFLSQYRDVPK